MLRNSRRLARDKYFEEEHRIAQHLAEIAPLAMVEKPGVPIDILEIRTGYPRAVGLQLDDLCRLKEVTTCFAKESDGERCSVVHASATPNHNDNIHNVIERAISLTNTTCNCR